MFNIHTSISSGAISRGYDRATLEDAEKCFFRVVNQLSANGFDGTVVMEEDGSPIHTVKINAA